MEDQAVHILAVVKNTNVSLDTKLDLLTKLKTQIKHHHVPDAAINPIFEAIRASICNSQLVDAGFSTLSHLAKRLELQNQNHIIANQGKLTLPFVLERLGDSKDRVRSRAIQALSEFWKASHADVEQMIRDLALSSKHPRAKEAAMQWLVKMNKDFGLPVKSFVPKMIECLEDADGIVRDVAKATIIALFQPLPEAAKSNLKKQLQLHNVRKAIVLHIYTQLGLHNPPEVELSSSVQTYETEVLPKEKAFAGSMIDETPLPGPVISESEIEAEKLDPIYVNSHRDLEDIFRDMHPYFEGKESEHNWSNREKSIVKLRRITKGNAHLDYTTTYLFGIKALLDGILKTVNSLRTTVCKNGCFLIQDIARAAGPGIDSMVEILLQALIKLCGGTKSIAAVNGDSTVDSILANVTYNVRLMQHIWTACQDKNVRPRGYATGWLKTIITKHGHHKHILEHASGLDLVDKCIKKGLNDASPAVRQSMRPTYWVYWRFWPDRSEAIMNTLDAAKQGQLLKDPSNPDPNRIFADSTAVAPSRAPMIARSTTSLATRPSLKETIEAQKRARMMERPESAQASASPTRIIPSRPGTSMATSSLSSAPLRPGSKPKALPKKINSPAHSPKKMKSMINLPRPASHQSNHSQTEASPSKPLLNHNDNAVLRRPTAVRSVMARDESQTPAANSPTKAIISDDIYVDQSREPPSRIASYSENIAPIPKGLIRATTDTDISLGKPYTYSKPLTRLHSYAEDMLSSTPHLARSLRNFEEGRQQQKASPTKAAEELTMLLPNTTTANDSPSLNNLQMNLPRNESESGRSILGELPLNHESAVRPSTSGRLTTLTSSEDLLAAPDDDCTRIPSNGSSGTVLRSRVMSLPDSDSRRPSFASSEQKLIDSGIVRIRARTLDAHGYRKLQPLITTRPDLWHDFRYSELFEALLGNIDTPKEDNTRGHVLKTLRLIVSSHPEQAKPFLPSALRMLLAVRSSYRSHTHLAAELEDIARDMAYLLEDTVPFMISIMMMLENHESSLPPTVAMGLETLADLMHRATLGQPNTTLDDDEQSRLGGALLGLMNNANVAVRKGAMECLLELYDMAGTPEKFWGYMGKANPDDRNLLTYFLAVRAGAA